VNPEAGREQIRQVMKKAISGKCVFFMVTGWQAEVLSSLFITAEMSNRFSFCALDPESTQSLIFNLVKPCNLNLNFKVVFHMRNQGSCSPPVAPGTCHAAAIKCLETRPF